MSKLALLGEFLIAPSAPAQGQIIYLAGGNLYVKDSAGKETRLDAIDPLGSIEVGPETVTVNGSGTMAFIDVPQIFVDDQEIDALLGVNAAPSTDAQVVVVSGAAGRRALRVKAATSPTVPAFDLMDSSNVARHELYVEYGTNIPAARTMAGYQEFSMIPAIIGPAQTLTIDILGNAYANQSVNMTIMMAIGAQNDGAARATLTDHVMWRTGANNGASGIIDANVRATSSIGGSVTVTGPTAITRGVRYTVANGNANNLNRRSVTILATSSTAVTVTASVA